jgi:subtilisin family serine protease
MNIKRVQKQLPKIPSHITEEWLKKAFKIDLFRDVWGFSFSDLSNCTFEKDIDENIINKVVISTKTKLPKEHPFNTNFEDYVDKDIKILNELGINGNGVNIAVIDKNFNEKHNEISRSIKEHISINGNTTDDFHGLVVASNVVGKTLGVAPKSNVVFYGIEDYKETHGDYTIKALEDIYERNLNGANIRLISISGYLHTWDSRFEEIKEKLLSTNCYVVDSPLFGDFFTCINLRQKNGEKKYEFSSCQIIEEDKTKLAIPYPGISPLIDTTSDYVIGGDTSYSWVIPRFTSIAALCMQVKPEITLDEIISLAYDTRYTTDDGKRIINPSEMIKSLLLNLEYNNTKSQSR